MPSNNKVCIIVLGDIGHSPRMENHAISLLNSGYKVDIVCYVDSPPLDTICNAGVQKCRIHRMLPVPKLKWPFPVIFQLIFKTFWQMATLLISLLLIGRPGFMLIQNPPGIPTLIVAYIMCKLTKARMIIDWHNYSYSILALKLPGGNQNLLCRLIRWIERFFGSRADIHFCVSKAMCRDLDENWGIRNAIVLYDRPPEHFQSIDSIKKREVLSKFILKYEETIIPKYFDQKFEIIDNGPSIIKRITTKHLSLTSQEVAIVISSTSWTPDEDFGILLKAFDDYDEKVCKVKESFPFLLCIITGKGPQKKEYREQVQKREWRNVGIITPWLSTEDYSAILAAGDLGICLHFSSSGLDLPMKVVDMFGCGLPVCAQAYECLQELVVNGKNGFVFQDHTELTNLLQFYFKDFPFRGGRSQYHTQFEKELKSFQAIRWQENWLKHVSSVFNT